MSQQDKKAAENIVNAFCVLPAEKQEYLIGYANGVADARAEQAREPTERQAG